MSTPDDDARWRLLFQHNPQPMWIFDVETLRFLAVNDAAVAHYGWSVAEFAAMTIKDIRPADEVAALLEDLAQGHTGLDGARLWRHRKKDGQLIHVEITAHSVPFEGRAGRLVLAQDVTRRVLAEQALRSSEARWQRLFAASATGIASASLEGRFVSVNPAFCALTGRAEADLLGAPMLGFTQDDDRERCQAQLQRLTAGEIESFRIDKRYLRPDGRAVWVRAAVALTQPGEMVQNQFVAVVVDIDAEREAEQRLRRQAALLDATRDAITVTGLDQRISFWNRGAERLFGWSADETLGRSARELLALNPLAAEEAQAQLLARGDWAGPLHLVRKDGRFLVTDTRWTLLRNAEGQPEAILTTQTDATQRLELEAQLRQAQRLEAVGQLTGGVAHDFNNLLTVILGNADLLAEMLADNPSLLPLAQMTRTAAERGAELTQRLLAFARKQALQPQAVDTHQLLASMDALLRRTLPAHIDLELVRAAGQWPALVDPAQLESAVLNLVLNARDAMPAGGKITLETANAWIDQDYAERHADVLPGQYVLLTVSDTGAGMAPGQLARAFEPFFTTKGPGQGSGLGLSMVYGFIKQSRGHVKLYSELGQGTTVRLYLPRADSAPSVLTPAAVRGVQELHGSARVLVVEDDALVRRHATDALTGLGYAVLAAEHGDAALAILRQRADIDLLFTDIVMPGSLNGRQLAEAALVLHPRLKVLYTSGYTENAIVHHGRLDRGVHLLPKPYRSLDLARKVHAVLRGT